MNTVDEGVTGTSYGSTAAPSAQDEIMSAVQKMLAGGLEYAPTPQMQPQRPWQNIVGNLGDALTAIGQVRAGGAPPAEGTYGRTVREKRLRFQAAQDDSLAANRDIKNRIRLAATEDALTGNRQRENAKLRASLLPEGYEYKTLSDGTVVAFPKTGPPGAPPLPVTGVSTGRTAPIPAPKGSGASGGAPRPPKTGFNENGQQIEYNPSTGRWDLSKDAQGKPILKAPSANMQGIQQQLDSASLLLANARANYLKAVQSGQGLGTRAAGTFVANTLGGELGSSLGGSGIAGKINGPAQKHERDREALATTLAFPLTGSRRSVEGARQSLLRIIPHFSDTEETWKFFEDQMNSIIANARRMPWGTPGAADTYADDLDRALTSLGGNTIPYDTTSPAAPSAGSGGGQFQGRTMSQDQFNSLKDTEKQRFTSGGGTVQ